mmetsp:Transcript_27884/g.67839  ORF Transcript_27884/g.67839 Transcript_27884/m.67839 type:complete len:516 (+) Transcript_27884:55-1602(+)
MKRKRDSENKTEPMEDVLLVPPTLTQSSYDLLKRCDAVPRTHHLEGRFGSRTYRVDEKNIGLPILSKEVLHQQAAKHPELKELLENNSEVSVVSRPFYRNHRFKEPPEFDARMHPEREIKREGQQTETPVSTSENDNKTLPLFTYAELFAGIGGFGVALEALGGQCVFMSELEDHIRALYCHNLHATNVHGDIYKVKDSEFPPPENNLDLVVGGFPCQPFSALGNQAGFDCEKGRGHLFLEIIRLMNKSRPKGFLLENVPGLLTMKETFEAIVEAFDKAGYQVKTQVCTARGLTVTQRKRLFLVGIRNDIAKSSTQKPFEFPFVPDLKLRAVNILDYEDLPQEELDILRLSDSTFEQLTSGRRWKPASMAWPNRTLDTITSHYGNSVGRGESQLVPCCSPHNPRRYSIRECARLMGFPNSYQFLPQREHQGDMAYRKENYRMFGNAVCPPLMAILAGAVLAACHGGGGDDADNTNNDNKVDWGRRGYDVAVQLAKSCTRGDPVDLPLGCQIHGSS